MRSIANRRQRGEARCRTPRARHDRRDTPYGRGAAETAWGEILSAHPRDSYVLATKVYFPMSDDPADQGLAPAQIARQIDASLTRLKTDHVDLYQAHRFDPGVPVEDVVEAFQKVVDQGEARCIGFSEWTPEQIRAALDVPGPDLWMSMPTLALAWVLRRGEVASAITGASRPEQVHANAAASGVELSDDLLAAVDRALGDVPVTGPTLAPGARPGVKHR
ncbi:aldo/keto reductase [Streptomyces longwoodensis]|uniref:aldo/keto reductase n=1 Tax=Streptomyces longwoodensis TaxID=68231 RepID=UPI0033C5BD1D